MAEGYLALKYKTLSHFCWKNLQSVMLMFQSGRVSNLADATELCLLSKNKWKKAGGNNAGAIIKRYY